MLGTVEPVLTEPASGVEAGADLVEPEPEPALEPEPAPPPKPAPEAIEGLAATRVQALARGRQARGQLVEQHQAVTKLQAIQRGKTARTPGVHFANDPPYRALDPAAEAQAEQEAKLREIFGRIDKDSDGAINRRELIIALRKNRDISEWFRLPGRIKQEDGSRDIVEAFFQTLDEDGSDAISIEELLRHFGFEDSGAEALATGLAGAAQAPAAPADLESVPPQPVGQEGGGFAGDQRARLLLKLAETLRSTTLCDVVFQVGPTAEAVPAIRAVLGCQTAVFQRVNGLPESF